VSYAQRDSFKGSRQIILKPRDLGRSFYFDFPNASSLRANDGAIPYGLDVTSVLVFAFAEDGSAVTSIFSMTSSVSSNIVRVTLNYPTEGSGKYFLEMALGLSDGSTMEADYTRVICEE